jgi:hypothetical protein
MNIRYFVFDVNLFAKIYSCFFVFYFNLFKKRKKKRRRNKKRID